LIAPSGETDLNRILKSLSPKLYPERYTFGTAREVPDDAFAIVREEEGMTVVRHDPEGEWARITLQVHSSVHAVGLMAAMATRLTELGISSNVIAGAFHDHLFVQWERRFDALKVLEGLAPNAA
jgi:hypothetical protein